MKAICIKNYVADNGDELWYEPDYFITIEQWRDNQLKLIGI